MKFLLALVVVLLAGCGAQPSEGEVKAVAESCSKASMIARVAQSQAGYTISCEKP